MSDKPLVDIENDIMLTKRSPICSPMDDHYYHVKAHSEFLNTFRNSQILSV